MGRLAESTLAALRMIYSSDRPVPREAVVYEAGRRVAPAVAYRKRQRDAALDQAKSPTLVDEEGVRRRRDGRALGFRRLSREEIVEIGRSRIVKSNVEKMISRGRVAIVRRDGVTCYAVGPRPYAREELDRGTITEPDDRPPESRARERDPRTNERLIRPWTRRALEVVYASDDPVPRDDVIREAGALVPEERARSLYEHDLAYFRGRAAEARPAPRHSPGEAIARGRRRFVLNAMMSLKRDGRIRVEVDPDGTILWGVGPRPMPNVKGTPR